MNKQKADSPQRHGDTEESNRNGDPLLILLYVPTLEHGNEKSGIPRVEAEAGFPLSSLSENAISDYICTI